MRWNSGCRDREGCLTSRRLTPKQAVCCDGIHPDATHPDVLYCFCRSLRSPGQRSTGQQCCASCCHGHAKCLTKADKVSAIGAWKTQKPCSADQAFY